MKRITFWLLSTLSVVVLLFGYDASSTTTTASPPAIVSGTGGSTGTSSSSSGSSSGSSGSGTTSGSSSGSSSGNGGGSTSGSTNVTGAVASTQWGPVQVELTVSGGKITQVDVVQYPSGNPKDQEINDYALPILVQETTDQQSADIDMVSGATVTSVGYIQSLQSALDQANL
jgi:major membrane immunogen (membrane-anchored lipoprotein)